MSSMLEELRGKHEVALARLQEWDERIQALPADAKDEEIDFLKDAFEKTNEEVKRWAESVERQQVIEDARSSMKPQDTDEPKKDSKGQVRVGKEPLTYRQHGPASFFKDIRDAQSGNADAQQRLQRHSSEMRVELRDISSSATAGGEFIPPMYLQNEWITLARAGRVTANLVTNRSLPPGTNTMHLPKLSSGSATAIQTADNAAIQETDPVTADYSVNVRTIAGQVDLSRQLFDLSQPGMDEIIFADLAQDYATKLDIQVISGSGSSGQAVGIRNVASINTVTYTDATPTVGELYPKIADAWQKVSTNLYRNADAIVMHPRRWAMFQGAVDSTGRPLASAEAPQNAVARGGAVVSEGLAGSIMGLPVYVDPNIPTNVGAGTNEDVILVLRTAEMILWEEGAPRTRVHESIGSATLTVRLQVFGYFAFAAGRYAAATSVISGTGLTPPTF